MPRWPFGFRKINLGPKEPWLPLERSEAEKSRHVVDAEACRAAAGLRGSPGPLLLEDFRASGDSVLLPLLGYWCLHDVTAIPCADCRLQGPRSLASTC